LTAARLKMPPNDMSSSPERHSWGRTANNDNVVEATKEPHNEDVHNV
jgi:hypothetical protein